MENDHGPVTASMLAVRSMLPSSEDRRKQIQDLFDRTQREKEAIKKARKAIKLQEQKALLQDRFEIDPIVIQMVMKMLSLPATRRSKVYFQFATLANDTGLDADMPLPDEALEEEHRDEGPVFDRTKTARRQGGKSFGPPVPRRPRRESHRVTRTRIDTELAEEMLKRLRMGLPARYRPGRPSNREAAAMEWAEARFAESGGLMALRAEADAQAADQDASKQEERRSGKGGGGGPAP